MERSFAKEVQALKLKEGEIFHGEGILAMTKALLQAGVSYIGGYQGAPISHMMDVLGDAQEILDELGVSFEACANEAAAAAMLGASINYPLRGAAVWKSVVGTNVASDALSNLASAGVKGGALILLGEDYGEGASIIQERSHAFALKSQMWLLDPRPNHEKFVGLIESAFDLSEASHTPVMMEFRIRTCHVHGSFVCKDNKVPQFSRNRTLPEPDFDMNRICLPPATYAQEKHKIAFRLPQAIDFIQKHSLNEWFAGETEAVGIVLQGGLYNSVMRVLQQLGMADHFGHCQIPLLVLNVTYPLVPEEILNFCTNKKAILMVEEGQPDYLEQALHVILRKAGMQTALHGKDVLPMAGEYTLEVLLKGMANFIAKSQPADLPTQAALAEYQRIADNIEKGRQQLGSPIPKRPPGFCVGCPERPIFSAMKIAEKELGKVHVSADIGCHTFSTLPPFNLGNTVLGYGLSLASSSGVSPAFENRVVNIMGDGGFWHNGLSSGVAGALFNKRDSILMIVNNGYTSATGQQYLPSTANKTDSRYADMTIPQVLKSMKVPWFRKVRSYHVGEMVKTLRKAMTTKKKGLKVIFAEGECQLARQRRVKPEFRKRLANGKRAMQTKFGVDEKVCTGDHSCIRLSGCPSLTIKPNPDPLRQDPVAAVDNHCLGCGLCGEVAQAAALCPSFYQSDRIYNPTRWERFLYHVRSRVIRALQASIGDNFSADLP